MDAVSVAMGECRKASKKKSKGSFLDPASQSAFAIRFRCFTLKGMSHPRIDSQVCIVLLCSAVVLCCLVSSLFGSCVAFAFCFLRLAGGKDSTAVTPNPTHRHPPIQHSPLALHLLIHWRKSPSLSPLPRSFLHSSFLHADCSSAPPRSVTSVQSASPHTRGIHTAICTLHTCIAHS